MKDSGEHSSFLLSCKALTRKVSCRPTLNDVNADFDILVNYGLAGLRRHRILRLTKEAHDLSGAMTHKREIIALYLQGCLTPTNDAIRSLSFCAWLYTRLP